MKIKDFLKEYKITLKELSEILGLSRPTLNTYIEQFEKGDKISNPLYQSIFTQIFNKNWGDKVEIIDEIKEIKDFFAKGNQVIDEDYCSENLELIESIKEKMYKDMKGAKEVLPLYKFINSVLYNYNSDNGLTGYIDYNLYLNGLINIKDIKKEEKILVSNIYPIMSQHIKNELKFNEKGYSDFLKRVKEIKEMREKESQRIEEEFRKKIREELALKFGLGKVIDDAKIDEILNKIKF